MIVGVLLAAGEAKRFGADKLLMEIGDGQCIAEVACANLLPAVDRLIAVVRPGADELADRLAAAGADVCTFADAAQGMGASLAHGVGQAPDADGWLVALADMPLVRPVDAVRVAAALQAGAAIVVPVCGGRRGHPVGFAQRYFTDLRALAGDQGARSILARNAAHIVEIAVDDESLWHDVDTDVDLALARRRFNRS